MQVLKALYTILGLGEDHCCCLTDNLELIGPTIKDASQSWLTWLGTRGATGVKLSFFFPSSLPHIFTHHVGAQPSLIWLLSPCHYLPILIFCPHLGAHFPFFLWSAFSPFLPRSSHIQIDFSPNTHLLQREKGKEKFLDLQPSNTTGIKSHVQKLAANVCDALSEVAKGCG